MQYNLKTNKVNLHFYTFKILRKKLVLTYITKLILYKNIFTAVMKKKYQQLI